MAATPDGKFLYVLTAANSASPSSTVTAYSIDGATGQLTAGPVISPDITSTMAIDPLGSFLYLTTGQTTPWQAASTVLPYTIDSSTGALTPAGTGVAVASNADALVADPSGRYLYLLNNHNSTPADNSVQALAVDRTSGSVTQIGTALQIDGQPAVIVCDPSGQFVYITSISFDSTTLNLWVYSISTDPQTAGQLLPNLTGGQPVPLVPPGGAQGTSLAVID
jgi:DNA-binding beta-propeller fold protein YncE